MNERSKYMTLDCLSKYLGLPNEETKTVVLADDFPRPFVGAGRERWLQSEVDAFMEKLPRKAVT